MPYYWFSTYNGIHWTPDKGYNGSFRDQVVLIRNWFHLKKTGIVGCEEGTGYWREYNLRGETVYVTVDKFTWNEYRRRRISLSGYEKMYFLTPTFRLDIRIASGDERYKREFFKDTLVVEFRKDFPLTPPMFHVESSRYERGKGSHAHHINADGSFCILAGSQDWNPQEDTLISAVNAAFDLIVWHYNIYGW